MPDTDVISQPGNQDTDDNPQDSLEVFDTGEPDALEQDADVQAKTGVDEIFGDIVDEDDEKPSDDEASVDEPIAVVPKEDPDKVEDGAADGGLEPELLGRALQAGFTSDEATGLGGPALRTALGAYDRAATSQQTNDDSAQGQGDAAKDADDPAKFEIQFLNEAEEGDYDPELVTGIRTALGGLNDHYHGQMAEMRSQQEVLVNYIRDQDATAFVGRLHGFMDGLPEGLKETYGASRSDREKTDGPQFAATSKFVEMVGVLESGYQGQNMPSEADLFQLAINALTGDKQQATIARKEIQANARKAAGRSTHRPTRRDAKPASSDERAASWAEKFLREKGFDADVEDSLDVLV